MAVERADRMVDIIRRRTHSTSFTDSATGSSQRGVQTETIIEFLNEAQDTCHSIVYGLAPHVFIKVGTIDTVADQEAYNLPADSFLGGGVANVEYKFGSGSGDYKKLTQKSIHKRDTNVTGTPSTYIHVNGQIFLNPIPSTATTNGIRLTYEFQLPRLDVRRGKVSAVDDGSAPTSITVTDKSFMDIAFGGSNDPEYITVVDGDGVQQMKSIPVTSYDSSTGILTLGSFTPSSGEVVAVNDYVVIGGNASTHSSLPSVCQHYLAEYARYCVLDLKGNPQAIMALDKVSKLEEKVVDIFSDFNTDIYPIDEIDPDRSLDLFS